ncbi:esterase-like activity of phytase family protein [Nigerium massiliense]|uniref:esterase-like activity of phytase family protein n=1 Tax=Nigerium massiliense TaxID=1522317 RepID=UPI00058C0930|nr:esterase-like activity of phytase family protein [Nigerium massiliense]
MFHETTGPTRAKRWTAALLTAGVVAVPSIGLSTTTADAHGRDHGRHHRQERVFNRVSTFGAYSNAADPTKEAVSEISTVTKDGRTAIYTDAAGKRIGFVDISDPNHPRGTGTVAVDGEPTSVYATARHLIVCVDTTTDFTKPSGKMMVFDPRTRVLLRTIDLGGQPDSIDVTPNGDTAVIAIENQRDEDATPAGGKKGDLPQLPGGELAVVSLRGPVSGWSVEHVNLANLPGMVAPTDPEPEYVKVSPDGRRVAVTLQENNHVAIVDIRSRKVVSSFSAGTNTVTGIDTKKDGVIDPTGSITDVPREPDSIGWIDNTHVATANEGDWKGGTRGWTIFDSRSGKITWDAGNSFERSAIANGQWNEDRAAKKGTEPEGLAVATYKGTRYAFVGSERSNFVNVYNVENPARPRFVQMLPSLPGPEGLLPIPTRGLFLVSSETDDPETGIRAGIQLYRLERGPADYPQLTSSKGIGWGALGALSASGRPGVLYTTTDSAYKNTRILTVDARRAPADIVAQLPVTKDGKQASYDAEGIWHNPRGGFWLGVEGATGPENKLVQLDEKGAVLKEVALPASYTDKLSKQGIEGITGTPDGKTLYIAMQREAKGEKVTRIGAYDVASGAFTWWGYPLEAPSAKGDWIGLSEITWVGKNKLAVIERDKLSGPAAKVKRLYTVTLDQPGVADGQPLPVLTKKLAHDVLPDLAKPKGWVQEKLEGMTVDERGDVYVITDNDALQDNTGETVFLKLGRVFR